MFGNTVNDVDWSNVRKLRKEESMTSIRNRMLKASPLSNKETDGCVRQWLNENMGWTCPWQGKIRCVLEHEEGSHLCKAMFPRLKRRPGQSRTGWLCPCQQYKLRYVIKQARKALCEG